MAEAMAAVQKAGGGGGESDDESKVSEKVRNYDKNMITTPLKVIPPKKIIELNLSDSHDLQSILEQKGGEGFSPDVCF